MSASDLNAGMPALSWTFGGALAGQPPVVAWSVLGAAAVAAAVFIWWSYRSALVEIPTGRRVVLCALRGAFWFGLLLILAAPTRLHRRYDEPPAARPLAVLADQSGSMTAADSRHRRRIDDALRRWRDMEPAARTAYREIKTFAFASELRPSAMDEAAPANANGETKLFAALQRVLAEAPPGGWGGVVALTDGLDTSEIATADGVAATTRAAASNSTALFFVPGRNRYTGGSFLGLRDFNVPPQTAPKSTFRVEAVIDSYQSAARTLELQLKINGVARPMTPLRLQPGRRLATWSTDIQAGDAGVIEIELKAGEETARASVRVARPSTNRILYFQGALDWSYRFLADILRRNPSFVLTPVFNFPNPNAVLPPGALRRMPEIPHELESFDIVILANAVAAQFTAAQQAALSTWVREGGVVLFFTPDDDSTQGFVGSELEKMLPVLFSSAARRGPVVSAGRVLSRFRGGSGATDTTKLAAFEWEKTPRVREIFATAEEENAALVSPMFSEYAHVEQAKPGADVLARHPTDLAANSDERAILLAIQRYGQGQSAVLTTDALWRWKLNRPADDRSAEQFWQTLFSWLARERQSGMRFEQTPRLAEVADAVPLRIVGARSGAVTITAVCGQRRDSPVASGNEGKVRVFDWHPSAEGLWELIATDAAGEQVRHWVMVKNTLRRGELSGLPPDEELLRTLATATGGAVLEATAPPAWKKAPAASGVLLSERREPLWHREWAFVLLLGLYCTEMILRRSWRLL